MLILRFSRVKVFDECNKILDFTDYWWYIQSIESFETRQGIDRVGIGIRLKRVAVMRLNGDQAEMNMDKESKFDWQGFIQSMLLGNIFIVFTLVMLGFAAWMPYAAAATAVLFISIIRSIKE